MTIELSNAAVKNDERVQATGKLTPDEIKQAIIEWLKAKGIRTDTVGIRFNVEDHGDHGEQNLVLENATFSTSVKLTFGA